MTADAPVSPSRDCSADVLAFVHRLLCASHTEQGPLEGLLTELVEAFAGHSAGLTLLVPGGASYHGGAEPTWEADAQTIQRLHSARRALSLPRASGGRTLATVVRVAAAVECLLWIEDEQRADWTDGEAAALPLAGLALERWIEAGERPAHWVEQIERRVKQHRLETIAQVARRLAHDFGNVFTGILGFTELSLTHPPPGQALIQSYLTEIYRSAQNGAHLTHQLRLFSRRQQVATNHCALPEVAEEEISRLHGLPEHAGKVRVAWTGHLPPLAIDKDHLRYVVAAVLENAVEASPALGEVVVAGQATELVSAQCGEYYGDLKPGRHVLLTIGDAGPGLTAEGWQRVLVEPFYSTKPKHRGLGLAVTYGILHAHRGGLRLSPRPEGGVQVEVLLPAIRPGELAATVKVETAHAPTSGQRVLVVDDDPAILSYVRVTLELAGYEVKTVTCAEDALRSYTAALPQRFQLVLSDVVMPQVTGVDLARQLLQRDAGVRMLFMSGQVGNEFTHQDLGHRFGMLCKPFAPDGLLRAVRSAIDRQGCWSVPALVPAS